MKVALVRTALALAFGLVSACSTAELRRFEFEEPAMGTRFRVAMYAESNEQADRAAHAAFARVHELDGLLSDYSADSELSRFAARSDAAAPTEWIPLGGDLLYVLARSQQIAQSSEGAFDVTVGPLTLLWRRARRQGELPRPERITEALTSVGWRKLEIDSGARAGRLLVRGMRLDLGGIAKGYAVDRMLAELAAAGIEHALVVGGGEVGLRGAPPGSRGWQVEVAPFGDMRARVAFELSNCAVSTSGDAYQVLELEGRRYSHVVDPRTGQASTERICATVIARDGTTADALATAACVLGPERGLAWVQRFEGVEARITREMSAGIESRATPGFDARILRSPPRATSSSQVP